MKRLKEVDWSKAPEGATHYNAKCSHPWLRETPASYFAEDKKDWVEYSRNQFAMDDLSNAVKRQQEWDGSGLPPVGTVCEYRLGEDGAWFNCKIMYVLSGPDDCFVAWCDHLGSDQYFEFSSDRYKLQLRKIKTLEQIAAEERENVIADMYATVMAGDSIGYGVASLYDAGYRKQGAMTNNKQELTE